jgi:hypothetical protein
MTDKLEPTNIVESPIMLKYAPTIDIASAEHNVNINENIITLYTLFLDFLRYLVIIYV